ncbi:VWA domain-containing protein [Edaphobacter modestus]|uniref:VWA domain-containing protein n=1 Tax=Edaphobacter modestus TaxID=388466 RepID=UPI00102BE433|nr:VWA domain-containing protein [Edaphobacter modestus]
MRKNLIWISGSFPTPIQRDLKTTGDPFAGFASFEQEFKETANLLADSRVAVYRIDPSGIVPPPSATIVDSNTSTNLAAIRRVTGSSSFTPADDTFNQDQLQQHATMENLAEATGGSAAFNSNDLVSAFRQAERNGSSYYTLTYVPPGTLADGSFRSIDVKVKGKSLHVAFRHGYYAAASVVAPSASSATLASAMRPLIPQSSEVLFTAEPLTAQQPPPGKTIGESAAGTGPHMVYSLNLVVDASTLTFIAAPDGKMHASIDFATVLYDAKGKVVDSRSDHADLALDTARYRGMIQGGLRFHHNVALNVRGDESVRIAVHDSTTDRIGTLQLTSAQISGISRPNI